MQTVQRQIYTGIRGKPFKIFLRNVLSLSNLDEPYYDMLLDKEGIQMYEQAFTHKSADELNNYEYLEFLGDVTLNKSIAWYLSRRFPHLNKPQGVKVLTRLKINLISKKSFAGFAKTLSFWDFVSADTDIRSTNMDKTLEDVFESFFGATELLIDSKIREGAGYHFCYNIISSLLDTKDISLRYEDLYDAKTRLKELIDFYRDTLGTLKYDCVKQDASQHVSAYLVLPSKEHVVLGKGTSYLKAKAEQIAATESIEILKQKGFVKPQTDNIYDSS